MGDGGDGKGLFDILESTLFGKENAAMLDPSIFVDDNEWRKSAHFGLHKRRVCIKETKKASGSCRYNVDVLEGFCVGEELTVRTNFGFSSEVRFDKMKKQEGCNYDGVGELISVPTCFAIPTSNALFAISSWTQPAHFLSCIHHQANGNALG